MKIGTIQLENPTLLAPLAGISDLPFRLLARQAGCALVTTEMVSADGLAHRVPSTLRLLRSLPQEKPLAAQIFGAEPAVMAEAARIVEDSGAQVLDLNLGCAVRKVVKAGAGVALMRAPRELEAILKAVRRAVQMPITLKIRSGWERSGEQALCVGALAEACGVQALTIHPRTAAQKFGGRADWGLIAALKRRLAIPVVGNGDIRCAADAVRMLSETGCDAVMIGRAAVGYPRIFTEVAGCLAGRPLLAEQAGERVEAMLRFLEETVACYGEDHAVRRLRTRLGWFLKGIPHSATLRQAAGRMATIADARGWIETCRQMLADRAQTRAMPRLT